MPLWILQWIASLKHAFSWGNSPLETIRADWASPIPKTPWLAGRLFELTREPANDLTIDDRTWSDLEYDRLFSLADSTRSPLGSQCLYRRLRTFVRDESALESEYAIYLKLVSQAPLREEIQLATSLLQNDFRGTNTPERIAAAKVVLEEMARHAQVLATTHDVELQAYLEQQFSIYHFTENPDLAEVFDYKLHAGISHARNAPHP